MREIGVRELKASLSSVLHRVEEGEQVKVTLRGRHVADIVPAGSRRSGERLRALVAEGRVTPASRSLPPRTQRPRDTGKSASAIVLEERAEEH
ncbi:MAG TPA: type II toxin-antitoxin system prevent-host-death family antitoxin [Solirubrobacterales bacterium]|nr:type II toxin-antitoxin system prevent-host-death family antitoxin [Solirubrobacterales bacterium]